jgi:hypothetical protein
LLGKMTETHPALVEQLNRLSMRDDLSESFVNFMSEEEDNNLLKDIHPLRLFSDDSYYNDV